MSESDPLDRRDYGRMEAQVEQLTKDVHALTQTMKEMNDFMQQSKGGWKTIALLGGIAGTIGAAISWIVTHVKFG